MAKPKLYFASITSASGRVCSLAIVVTHWKTEGTALYERLAPGGRAQEVMATGIWRLGEGPEGASVLSIEWTDTDRENIVDLAICDLLMLDITQQGLADTFERSGA